MNENVRALSGNPEVDIVCGNFGEDQAALARPGGAFGPLIKIAGDFFGFRARRYDRVERGIELLDFLRIGGRRNCGGGKKNENASTWKSFHDALFIQQVGWRQAGKAEVRDWRFEV